MSIFGNLFGGSSHNARPDYTNTGNGIAAISGLGNRFQQYGQGALGDFTTRNAGANTDLNRYIAQLRQNPHTDTENDAARERYTSGVAGAYAGARSRIAADSALSGFAPGSSMAQGALTSLDTARAGQSANAANSAYEQELADQRQRMAEIYGLQSGAAGTDYARGMGALGQAGGQYGNATQFLQHQDDADYQARSANEAANAQDNGLFGDVLGQAAGAYAGGALGGGGLGSLFRPRKRPNTAGAYTPDTYYQHGQGNNSIFDT